MGCDIVELPGGVRAIVCSRGSRGRSKSKAPQCVSCSKLSGYQCDWKTGGVDAKGEPRRCDAHLCEGCARTIAPGKHVCPVHSITFDNWRRAQDAKKLHQP